MSILSDLLSRAKQQQPKRDVPPGLRGTVSTIRREESRRKNILRLTTIMSIVIGLGLATIYMTGYYRSYEGKEIIASQTKRDTEGGQTLEPTAVENAAAVAPNKTTQQKDPQNKKTKTGPALAMLKISEHETSPAANLVEVSEPRPVIINKEITQRQSDQEESTPGLKESSLYAAERDEKSGDIASAKAEYQKVLDLDPKNYRVMNKIAFLLMKMGRFNEAEGYLKNAMFLRQDYIPSLVNLAIISAKTEKTAEAEDYLQKALSIDGSYQAAMLNLAILYEREHKYDKAKELFLRLRKLGNNNGDMGIQRLENAQ